MITVRHAWLQKHPSPAAATGEFHWYPRDGDRELRATLVERLRGVEAPAVLWELAPGRVVWARSFAAIAPTDGRRYLGLVLTIAEGSGQGASELLRALDVPAAAPWNASVPEDLARAAISEFPVASELDALPRPDLIAIARGLLSGGSIRISDPGFGDLALFVAAVDRHVPHAGTSRQGAWIGDRNDSIEKPSGVAPVAGVAGSIEGALRALAFADADRPSDRVAALLASAARELSEEARAWRVLCELAAARGESVDRVAASSDEDPLTDEERAALARHPTETSADSLASRLHAWGRGRFDLCPTAGSILDRLADAVALRVLAELATGGDPRRPIADVRWYALLPAERRTSLLQHLLGRAASLRSLVEISHA